MNERENIMVIEKEELAEQQTSKKGKKGENVGRWEVRELAELGIYGPGPTSFIGRRS